MKTTMGAVAAAGLLASMASHAQSSVTLYGSLDAGIAYVNNAEGSHLWQQSSGLMSNNYFGLRGTEDLGGGLSAIFKLESGFNINDGEFDNHKGNMFGREAYVGLGSMYGTMTMGRQYDSVYDYLSPLSLAGQVNSVNLAAHYGDIDNIGGTFSTRNAVKFTSANFNGLSASAMYAFSNNTESFNAGQMWGTGLSYETGPFRLAAAYVDRRNSPTALGANNDDPYRAGHQRVVGGGVNYTTGPLSVGLVYTHTQLENASGMPGGTPGTYGNHFEVDNIENHVTYNLTPALTLLGSHTFTYGNQSANGTKAKPKAHTVVLGADYSLSKRTDFYLASAYQHMSGDQMLNGVDQQGNPIVANDALGSNIAGIIPSSTTNNQVVVGVGLRHRF
jgi:general bacterial porin, GBP family